MAVQHSNSNAIVFESADKTLAAELLTSSSEFTPGDVRNLANVGAITTESAKHIITRMEGSAVKLDKEMKKNVLHRKALIVAGKDKNDPLIRELVQLHEAQEKIFEALEEKYGAEATVNQGSLIGKLMSKFRNSPEAAIMESCRKISEFQ